MKKLHIYDMDSLYIVAKMVGDSLKYGMIDNRNDILLPTNYDKISRYKTNLFIVERGRLYGIYDSKGNQILSIEYTGFLRYLVDTYYIISKDGKLGIFDSDSKELILPTEYKKISYKDYGVDPVYINRIKSTYQTSKYTYRRAVINKDSIGIESTALFDLKTRKMILPFGMYDQILPSDGNEKMILRKGSQWEIIGYDGKKYLLDRHYSNVSICPYGFITWDYNLRKFGFISLDGKVVDPAYSEIIFYENGFARIKNNNYKEGALRYDGEIILPAKYDFVYPENDYISFGLKDKVGIAEFDGKILFQPNKYDGIEYYSNDKVAVVRLNNKEGLVNEKGKTILPIIYRNVYFDKGIARICVVIGLNTYKWGIYNIKTKKILKPQYDGLSKFVDGISVIGYFSEGGNKYGLLDQNGKEIISPIYETMFFDEKQQYATVSFDKKYGMINRKGTILIPVRYDEFKEFRTEEDENGIAIVSLSGKQGLYNFHSARELLPAVYDQIIDFKYGNGGIRYLNNGKYGFMDYNGQTILPQEYDFISIVSNCLSVKKHNKYGIANYNGQLLTPIQYNYLDSSTPPQWKTGIIAQLNDKYGIIDMQGNVLVPFGFDKLKYSYKLGDYIAQKGTMFGILNRATKIFYENKEKQMDIKIELNELNN